MTNLLKNSLKNLFLLSIALFAAQSLSAQGEKTLVKTLDPKNADFVVFNLPASTTFRKPEKWDNNTLRIELEVHANMTEDVMVQLIKANRYNFDGAFVEGVYTITAPNLEKKVTIHQVDLVEKIYVNVTAPHNYTLDPATKKFSRDISDFISSRGITSGSVTTADLLKIRQFSEPVEVYVRFVSTLPAANTEKVSPKAAPKSAEKSKSANRNASEPASIKKPAAALKYGDILIDDVPIDPF
jgi:hypothetical protein